jgi:hypothetical protein
MSKKIEDLLTDQSFRRFVLNPQQGNMPLGGLGE